jgi:hypothetical protein
MRAISAVWIASVLLLAPAPGIFGDQAKDSDPKGSAGSSTILNAESAGVYLSFFQEVSARENVQSKTEASPLNGQPASLQRVSTEDAMALTSQEVHSLVQTATLCQSEIKTLDTQTSALIFESRLEAANDGAPSETTAARLKEIEARRIAIIGGHLEELKSALGEDTFRKVRSYVAERAGKGSFFPAAVLKKL